MVLFRNFWILRRMAVFRYFSRNLVLNQFQTNQILKVTNYCAACSRSLSYSPIQYDGERDPAPLFFNKDVQSLLKLLTRVDLAKVYKRRKLGAKKLEDPEYKFMTDEQLQKAMKKAEQKVDSMLQIPPVVLMRKPICRIFSKDPALQGLETTRMVFTDITFGIKDSDRLIVVREPDGTLQEAEWELRKRINQVYFPKSGRTIKPSKMFEDRYLYSLLNRQEYEFVLDNACVQFEPNDPEYQRVVSITYQHVNDNNGYELLRSTRHFGSLIFFLVWNKNIDNLLLELIETAHIDEGYKLVELYCKVNNVSVKNDNNLTVIEDYIKSYANKKGNLELGLQAYKDLARQREDLEMGIKAAHGLN